MLMCHERAWGPFDSLGRSSLVYVTLQVPFEGKT